jgi:Skp family chaperone for outer membrane proteins
MNAWTGRVLAFGLFLIITGFDIPPVRAEQMQPPVIAVIDFQRIVRASIAGKFVRQQVDKRHATFQSEIRKLQLMLERDRAELRQGKSNLTPAEFKKKRHAYEKNTDQLQRLVQTRKRHLDSLYVEGMRKVELTLIAVMRELATERKINIILNATRGQGVVLFADNKIVLTSEALTRLDKKLPTLELPTISGVVSPPAGSTGKEKIGGKKDN